MNLSSNSNIGVVTGGRSHAPEVECLSKGKVAKRYEFGVKASIATKNRSNFVVGGLALLGNPYDGHTLNQALAQVCIKHDLPVPLAPSTKSISPTSSLSCESSVV